ncbi:LytR/AlgR family response regulator transcription factor [Beduini massiliensis]|uniref:LytR/AlgR family response regulator transcription factor n=1 Tax=Beduini massiliensis TaxID=1585974 RepID=UPI003567FADA
MNILIIEDKKPDIKQLEEILFQIEKNQKNFFNITSTDFLNYNDLLSLYKYDLIFLGIELKNGNGIDIGKKIRYVNNKVKLVIVTHHQRYMLEGYKIKADRYFLKPLNKDFFEKEMIEIFNDLTNDLAGIYDPSIYEKKIYFKDIIFIEYYLRHSKVYLYNGKILETKKSLKDWAEIVTTYDFAYSHKSFIVNFLHIKKITNKDIIMKSKDVLPLSRHYKEEFKNAYILYLNQKD